MLTGLNRAIPPFEKRWVNQIPLGFLLRNPLGAGTITKIPNRSTLRNKSNAPKLPTLQNSQTLKL
jgi:hypothetical protein